jgi:hypothetical protein
MPIVLSVSIRNDWSTVTRCPNNIELASRKLSSCPAHQRRAPSVSVAADAGTGDDTGDGVGEHAARVTASTSVDRYRRRTEKTPLLAAQGLTGWLAGWLANMPRPSAEVALCQVFL